MKYVKRLVKKLIKKIIDRLYPEVKYLNQQIINFDDKFRNLDVIVSKYKEEIKAMMDYIDQKDPEFLKEVDKKYLPKIFKEKLGYELNLDNPKTFNEKLQWLKIHYRKPEMTVMADKYLVRKYLEEKGLGKYLNSLYGVYDNVDELLADWGNLPTSFVIKANHWSGGNLIVKKKSSFNLDDLSKLSWLLNNNYYFLHRCGEWPYKDIKPCIIAEKYLEDETGGLLDYKVFCFNGEARYIQVDVDRFTEHTRGYYDTSWHKEPFTILYPKYNKVLSKPFCIEEMISVAETLSRNFPHARIDFYEVGEKLMFGEVTFTHGSGFERFIPEEWDYKLGELIDLQK